MVSNEHQWSYEATPTSDGGSEGFSGTITIQDIFADPGKFTLEQIVDTIQTIQATKTQELVAEASSVARNLQQQFTGFVLPKIRINIPSHLKDDMKYIYRELFCCGIKVTFFNFCSGVIQFIHNHVCLLFLL